MPSRSARCWRSAGSWASWTAPSRGFDSSISTTTRTGQALARERFGAERVFYCPLDLPWAVRAYLNALQPRLLILAETEFWPNLLSGCFRRRIPVAVVNARISDRSWPRYRTLRRLWRPFLAQAQPRAGAERDRRRAAAGARLPCQSASRSPATSSSTCAPPRRPKPPACSKLLRRGLAVRRRRQHAGRRRGRAARSLAAAARSRSATRDGARPAPSGAIRAVAALLDKIRHSLVPAVGVELAADGRAQAASTPAKIVLLDTIGELASVYSLAASPSSAAASFPPAGTTRWNRPSSVCPSSWVRTTPTSAPSRTTCVAHHALRIAAREELGRGSCRLCCATAPKPRRWARAPGRSLTSRPAPRSAASRLSVSCSHASCRQETAP